MNTKAKTFLSVLLVALLFGCSARPHPVMTATEAGASVEVVTPARTMDRDNVPVGVDPDKVIAHVTDTATGEEAWIVDQGIFKPKKIYRTIPPITTDPTTTVAPDSAIRNPHSALNIDIAERPWYYWPVRVLILIAFIAGVALLVYLKSALGWFFVIIKKLFGGNA